jgi:hypothetical protein
MTAPNQGELVVQSARPDSIPKVVELVETELHSLLQRRNEISRRIQSVHRIVHGLQEGVGEHSSSFHHLQGAFSGEAVENMIKPARRDSTTILLKRACRIALMEAQQAASSQEIYSRVLRRGSFSFANFEYGLSSIVWALSILVEDGEAYCFRGMPEWRWQRTTRSEEPSSETPVDGSSQL